jgi:hypothetical protein
MNAPRAHTHMDRLLQEFKSLAEQALHLPSITELATKLGITNTHFYFLLDRGKRRGLWELERDGARIIAIYERNGDWRVPCAMRRWRAEEAIPSRKCLRCRGAFAPAHKGNFMCQDCREFAAQAAP